MQGWERAEVAAVVVISLHRDLTTSDDHGCFTRNAVSRLRHLPTSRLTAGACVVRCMMTRTPAKGAGSS